MVKGEEIEKWKDNEKKKEAVFNKEDRKERKMRMGGKERKRMHFLLSRKREWETKDK